MFDGYRNETVLSFCGKRESYGVKGISLISYMFLQLPTVRMLIIGLLTFLKGDLTEILDRVDPNVVMRSLEKGTRDKKILGLIKSALDGENEKLRDVSLKEENVDELRRLKKRRATKKRILKDNEPKPDPYWLRTFFSFSPEEAAKVPDYGFCVFLAFDFPGFSFFCFFYGKTF